jgi:hypothetical protein
VQYTRLRASHLRAEVPEAAAGGPSFEGVARFGTSIITMVQEDIRYLLTVFKSVAPLPALLGALYVDRYGKYAQELLARGQVRRPRAAGHVRARLTQRSG